MGEIRIGGGIAIGPGAMATGQGGSINIGNGGGVLTPGRDQPNRAPLPAVSPEVFVSYSRDDHALVQPIIDWLRYLRVDVWVDALIAPGSGFDLEIAGAINASKSQIVCWSPAAIASDWVRGEAELGRLRGALIPVMLRPATLLPPFNLLHAEDLSGWDRSAHHAGWGKTLRAVGERIGRPGLDQLAIALQSQDAGRIERWGAEHPQDAYVLQVLNGR